MRRPLVVTALLVLAAIVPTDPASAGTGTETDPRVVHADPAGAGTVCSVTEPCDLATAQARSRERIAQGKPATVELHGGTYTLAAPLSFDASDSGSPGRATVYRAAAGEQPVLSAGTDVTSSGWVQDGARWHLDVGAVDTRQLYVNGHRAVRARDRDLPADWTATASGYQASDDRIASWPDRDQVEVVVNTWWRTYRCGIQDAVGSDITIDPLCWKRGSCGDPRWSIYGERAAWIENAMALLDEPGEWFHDRASGRLYYMPRTDEDMTTAHVVAAAGEAVVRGAAGVHDLRLEGLTFSHAGWLAPNSDEGFVETQAGFHLSGDPSLECNAAWVKIPAAVEFEAAQRVKLVGNRFEHLGGSGVYFGSGSRDNKVSDNLFQDISGTGIALGGIGEQDHHPTDPAWVVRGNRIDNNVVTQMGQEYFGTVGIWVGYAQKTVIAHNELSELPYTAISLGWGWGSVDPGGHPGGWSGYTTASTLRDNRVEHNLIRDILQVNSDGGGIYTLSAQPGTVIRKNVVTGLRGLRNHPIYLDDGSRYMTVASNVVVGNDHTAMYKGGSHVFRDNYWQNRYVGDLWDWNDTYDGAWAAYHYRDFYGATRMTGNHLISSLDEAPASIVDAAGPITR